MYLSDLQTKEIINLVNGQKLGKIIDAQINGNIIMNLIVEQKRTILNIFKKKIETIIKWEMIKKIGEDVILVEMRVKKEE